jgi:hypothetical protein
MSKYNIVALDPSLISTGLVVSNGSDTKLFNYCRENDATNKSGLSKWFKLAEPELTLRFIEYRDYNNYSDGELIKLKDYDKITSMIIRDIEENIDKSLPTKIGIEGYSFGSNVGPLIDLVTFSTLLRKKLFDYIGKDILVLSPSTLKLEACKLTYPPINEGKKKEKWVYKNNDGISAGSLTKHGIFLTIIENKNINDAWGRLCKSLKSDIMAATKVPKPFEDLNDAFCIFNILKGNKGY